MAHGLLRGSSRQALFGHRPLANTIVHKAWAVPVIVSKGRYSQGLV
jgi:hypothetical protein